MFISSSGAALGPRKDSTSPRRDFARDRLRMFCLHYLVLNVCGTRLYGDWAGFTDWLIALDNFARKTFSCVRDCTAEVPRLLSHGTLPMQTSVPAVFRKVNVLGSWDTHRSVEDVQELAFM